MRIPTNEETLLYLQQFIIIEKDSYGEDFPIVDTEKIKAYYRATIKTTAPFSEAAEFYKKHGAYTTLVLGPKYKQFWAIEAERCRQGVVIDDIYVPGKMYFYLNYCKIELKLDEDTGKKIKKKGYTFPRFWETDYQWYIVRAIAEFYGKHIICLKTRRAGFSWKVAAEAAYNYVIEAGSKSWLLASKEDFLWDDGIWAKTYQLINILNEVPAFKRLSQKVDQYSKGSRRASYMDVDVSPPVERGTMSEVSAVVVPPHNPNKVRGKTGKLVVFEEAGSFGNLLSVWAICEPQVSEGGDMVGTMIAFGTGGDTSSNDILGLQTLFNNPEAYSCLACKNVWEDSGGLCGFFVPTTMVQEVHMDPATGIFDEDAIRKKEEKKRALKAKDSAAAKDKHTAENPFTPTEALYRINTQKFPIGEILERIKKLQAGLSEYVTPIEFTRQDKTLHFIPTSKKPYNDYPVKKDGMPKEPVPCILEHPYKDRQNAIPDNMYFIVYDPYYNEGLSVTTDSIASAYVMKREGTNDLDGKIGNIPVAWMHGRDVTKAPFHDQLFELAEYYNAKIQFEIAGGGQSFFDYAKYKGKLSLLWTKAILTGQKSYGVSISGDNKNSYLEDFATYLKKVVGYGPDGKKLTTLDYIFDIGLLRECASYTPNKNNNTDRISAMLLAVPMNRALGPFQYKNTHEKTDDFFDKKFI